MKVFFFFDDFSGQGPVWLNVMWPHFNTVSESADATILEKPPIPQPNRSRLTFRWNDWRQTRVLGKGIRKRVLRDLDPNGPNVLLVGSLNPRDVRWSAVLHPIWSAFSHRVLLVDDVFQPRRISPKLLSRFDRITCFCRDLADEFERASGVPTLYWPAHTDVLNFHSTSDHRPIDLIVVGRRNWRLHGPLHHHFNAPERQRIFLDFVTRTKMKLSCENEFRLLMATYSRSKAAFCFEPSDLSRFEGRSPMTSRWIHAWSSGCTVFGKRPTGSGVKGQMDWPESTIDLPDSPMAAIRLVEDTLCDEDAMRRRRKRNVIEAIQRHDTRHRLRDLFSNLNLPLPAQLQDGLAKLTHRAEELSAGGGHDQA